ncbi:MAG TPA: hypothetical protein VH877_00885, partial [Polyangia bacterium]|nr:hypothetical protein [Polyangia bacterium]
IFDGGGAPPMAAPSGGLSPLTEQKTVIFDGGGAPPMAAPPGGLPPMAEQRTVIFSDPSSPGGAPQVPGAPGSSFGGAGGGGFWDNATRGMAPTPGGAAAGGAAQRTMMLDAPQSLGPPGQPSQPPAQAAAMAGVRSFPPAAAPLRSKRWMRWLMGTGLMIGTAVLTLVVSAYALPAERFRPKEPPPVVVKKARMEVSSVPSGASITIDGKPWPDKTPTRIEGVVGQRVHIECRLDGQLGRTDVEFSEDPPPIEIPLTPDPKAQKARPAPPPDDEEEPPPPPASKRPTSKPSHRSSHHR